MKSELSIFARTCSVSRVTRKPPICEQLSPDLPRMKKPDHDEKNEYVACCCIEYSDSHGYHDRRVSDQSAVTMVPGRSGPDDQRETTLVQGRDSDTVR